MLLYVNTDFLEWGIMIFKKQRTCIWTFWSGERSFMWTKFLRWLNDCIVTKCPSISVTISFSMYLDYCIVLFTICCFLVLLDWKFALCSAALWFFVHYDAAGIQVEEFNEIKQCYPHGFHGVHRYGRPIYIERIEMINLTKLHENIKKKTRRDN